MTGGSTRALLVAAMVACAGGVWAADQDAARLPKPRPATEPPRVVAEWAEKAEARFRAATLVPVKGEAAAEAIESIAPLPRPRPGRSASMLAMVAPTDREADAPVVPRLAPPVATESAEEYAVCIGRLRALGVEFEEMAPIGEGGCTVARPLKVAHLGSGVGIGPETILTCGATQSLAEWVKDVVVPSAERLIGSAPKTIVHDSAYVCRTRYNDPHAKISEHARANAIDIASIGFGDHVVAIGGSEAGSTEARFETAIRAGSCSYFTTVLGPGSNAAHATHFHLDMAERRGGYRLCELGEPMVVRALENTKRE